MLMWPFKLLRRRTERRRFTAAVILYLAVETFRRLSPGERARVDAEINRFSPWSWSTPAVAPASALRRWAPWDLLACERVFAMARLGIRPVLPQRSFAELLAPWSPQWQLMINDFRPMDPATAKAKQHLRDQGLDVPDADPWQEGGTESVNWIGSTLSAALLLDRDEHKR